MEKKILLSIFAVIALGIIAFPFAGVGITGSSLPSVILSPEELFSLKENGFQAVVVHFTHTWGNAFARRDIVLNGDGLVVIQDWQDAQDLKDNIISGKLDSGFCPPSELKMIMRDDVNHNWYFKGYLNEKVIKSILSSVAAVMEGKYKPSLTEGDPLSETIRFEISAGEEGLIVTESVNMPFHNIDKLNMLFQIENIIEDAVAESDLVQLDMEEYGSLLETIGPQPTSEVRRAQKEF